ILRNDVHSTTRPLPAFHRGRVALLGDAAHAMAPSLGQGGCQAIEDAVVLAHALLATGDHCDALAEYTRQRLPRTTAVVRRSARVARLTRLSSPLACALRTAALTTVNRFGPRVALRSLDGVADWRPPVRPARHTSADFPTSRMSSSTTP
ncbi:FAD-dependent monooxygenase, partial [Streptomyces sp. UNOB3_S3]|uniref:FAD-dependent monooxygenase n=1 Tax=Streptomyces sp. UNOB3_S3 TaxID=2871682 RepID=UPI001E4CB673